MKSGLDLSHVNPLVRPQDDLFRHMNGNWLDNSVIPLDRASDGAFYQLYEDAERQVRDIIEELSQSPQASESNAQKIGDLYASFMDENRANELGITPIKKYLDQALSVSTRDEFFRTLGYFETLGLGGLFYTYINTDARDSTTYISYFGQSGLSLPDEAYYREAEHEVLRDALLIHIEKMFTLANLPDGATHAKNILELETKIASYHWDQVKDRDAVLTYNKLTFDELKTLAPKFDWSLWIEHSLTPMKIVETAIIQQPSFFSGMSTRLGDFEPAQWSSWLAWHALSGAAPYLNSEIISQNFYFYGTTLSGTPELRIRWKRGVGLVQGALGEAIGQIYVERHFPPAAKERMNILVANLLEAYRVDISALEWMSEATKIHALEKLAKFTPKIGYPDKWRDYSALKIVRDDLMGNLARLTTFAQEYEYAKVGSPVDRSEWHMTPQTVNAYYNPGLNEIVFPAAILQPPFFNLDADDAANYGGIGAVIGHEMGHGFDHQGSKYDGDGNLHDWWTDEDREKFDQQAQVLIEQFDALHPLYAPDLHVNGALTVGENIGDLGGLIVALKAYEISLNGQIPPELDGFSGLQRFFLGFAQAWRTKRRPEEVRHLIAIDPHSPEEFRCNQIVRNLNEFYEAFGVVETDRLYLAPAARVRIW